MKISSSIISHILFLRTKLRLRLNSEYQQFKKTVKVYSADETIDRILAGKLSVARYGDGEFAIMGGGHNAFQTTNKKLAERLIEVMADHDDKMFLCIASSLVRTDDILQSSKEFILGCLTYMFEKDVNPFVDRNYHYGDALFTRFYMMKKDKSHVGEYVKHLKKLWDKRDLLIVEGINSRLGVGNDLFDNAEDIKRILCPPTNAFDKYDKILEASKKHAEDRLVIIALGMTATVLAYDLCKAGIQTMDLGHIDVEYEWFRMGATHKVALPNKAVNEVGNNTNVPQCTDPVYQDSILEIIT